MTIADTIDRVDPENVSLVEALLGYDIRVQGEYAGGIEGYPGYLEYIEIDLLWEDKGVARAGLNKLIELSKKEACSKITTTNAMHPAMEHILETEGFEQQSGGWQKEIE
jgi:hypothetical protein